MSPAIGKAAFTLGLFIEIAALICLLGIRPSSPAFIIDLMALIIGAAYLGVVIAFVRRSARHERRAGRVR